MDKFLEERIFLISATFFNNKGLNTMPENYHSLFFEKD